MSGADGDKSAGVICFGMPIADLPGVDGFIGGVTTAGSSSTTLTGDDFLRLLGDRLSALLHSSILFSFSESDLDMSVDDDWT